MPQTTENMNLPFCIWEKKKEGLFWFIVSEVLAHGQLVPLFWLKARQNTMAVVVCGGGSPLHWARKQRKRHRAKDKDSLPRTIPHGLCPPVRPYFQLSTLHNNAIKLWVHQQIHLLAGSGPHNTTTSVLVPKQEPSLRYMTLVGALCLA